ncbi:MAG: hypothetical protein RL141_979 [Candidatus Parcubacteria bacterium]|jgi:DNA-binding transcriptional ArsR family regulator
MKKIPLRPETEKMARWLALAGDPTRLRIFYLLFAEKEACVSQIAESLGMTIANISHHLQLLKDNGLCTMERKGNTICYQLIQNDFTQKLKSIIG